VPGDEIIGYVTRGRGVSIHRTDCPNIINLPEEERKRLLEAEWGAAAEGNNTFIATIQVITTEKKGLLMDISSVINHEDINIDSLAVRRTKNNQENIFSISVEITAKSQLEQLVKKLLQVPGVYDVLRANA